MSSPASAESACDFPPECMVSLSPSGVRLAMDENCNFVVNDDGNEYAFCVSNPTGYGTMCNWNFVVGALEENVI